METLKCNMTFSILKMCWFEVTFSNQADFNLIWANSPYHMFSQLLMIKHWYPGLDPTTESISQLDLWVRLHYLPEEFANSDALETIIEGNFIGKFLKMDLTHNSEWWNMFTRFCIHTDVEKTFGKGVIDPDKHFNQIKFGLWFDDFSTRCGACGKTAHVYKDCPNKNAPIPTLQLTIKKPSSKSVPYSYSPSASFASEKWNHVGKNNKTTLAANKHLFPSNSIYLSEKGGINFTYESDESDELINQFLKCDETFEETSNLIVVADDIIPNGLPMEINTGLNAERHHGFVPHKDTVTGCTNTHIDYVSPDKTIPAMFVVHQDLGGFPLEKLGQSLPDSGQSLVNKEISKACVEVARVNSGHAMVPFLPTHVNLDESLNSGNSKKG